MNDNLELESLAQEIKDTEQKLINLRKEYRDQRTAGLRAALEARNEADAMIREEMKALGYRYNNFTWRNIA
jgi:hypothetical protein